MLRDWALAVAMSLVVPSLLACAASQRPSREGEEGVAAEEGFTIREDRSWCLREVSGEREVEEAAGAGSPRPNIRRVFVLVGHGDEARRVLVCREVDEDLDGRMDVVRSYDERGLPVKEVADTDYDGKIDTWMTFFGGRVSQVLIDRNGDEIPDEKRSYVRGRKLRAELDENFDGRTDVWEIYEDGGLRRRGVDVDGDGKVDRWDRDESAHREEERREAAAGSARGGADQGDAGATGAESRR